MKGGVIHKDTIVIGSNLSALIYAYCNDCSFFATTFSPPHDFDYFSHDVDISEYGLLNFSKTLKSPNGKTKIIGIQKQLLWHRLNAILSLGSKNIMPFEISQAKIQDNIIKLITNRGRMASYSFSKLIVFDEHNVDLPIVVMPPKIFQIYDYIDIISGQNVPYNFIDTKDKLVKTIWFYGTRRNYNKNLKDLVAVSYATYEDLNTFEWTDTGVMFKVKSIMKANGLRGTRNGKDPKYPGKYKYYAIKLVTTKRDVVPIRQGKNSCIDNIEIRYDKDEDLIKNLKIQDSFMSRLNRRYMNAQIK